VEQHPPIDHPGRIRAEQIRAAHQTQGGPLSGLQQFGERVGHAAGEAAKDVEGLFGGKPETGQQKPAPDLGQVAGIAARQATRLTLPPTALQFLPLHPAYPDNPWLPVPQEQLDPMAAWTRARRVSKAWRAIANPDLVHDSIHDIINDHSWQGELKRVLIGID